MARGVVFVCGRVDGGNSLVLGVICIFSGGPEAAPGLGPDRGALPEALAALSLRGGLLRVLRSRSLGGARTRRPSAARRASTAAPPPPTAWEASSSSSKTEGRVTQAFLALVP